jgi:hypothetical protein
MGGQAFEMPFVGTIKGDKIEGSFSGQFGEMAITGERKKSENLVGDWEFNMTVGGGGGGMGMEMQFVIDSTFSKNDEGAYTATWDQQMQPMEGAEAPEGGFGPPGGGMGTMDVKISNIKLEGNKLTFTQNVSMGDMAFASDFSGTIEGDAITGTLSSEMGGDIPLTGKRKTADPLSGNWAFEMNFSGGGAGGGGGMGMDMQFVIDATFSKDDAGAYTATWDQQMKPAEGADAAEGGFGPPGGGMGGMGAMEVTVSDIKLDGNKLTFTREVSMGDTPFQSDFSGTIEGDTITGTISSEMTGEIPLTGKRKAE